MTDGALNTQYFLPVLVRTSSLFVFTPFFSGRNIPVPAKVGIALLLSFLVFSVRSWGDPLPGSGFGYLGLLLSECLIGFVMGTFLSVILAAFQAAGSLISYQIGFSLVSSYSPDYGQIDVIGEIQTMLVMTLFLLLDGHQRAVEAICRSYELIPIGHAVLSPEVALKLISSIGEIFALALKIGAPVIVTLWMTSAFLALLNRMLPQMNIFSMDFPVKITAGLLSLGLSLPYIANHFSGLLRRCWTDVASSLYLMRG